MLAKLVIGYLEENKDEIVDELNKKINIPLISEKKEEATISSVYDCFLEILSKLLSR
jgi:uncharacterized protein YciU (UPF0263 family)